MNERKQTVDVLIPTRHPDKKFLALIHGLQHQTYPVQKIIVMNTEEKAWKDSGMEQRLQGVPMELHHVTTEEFDHGATRNQGMEYSTADVVLCMTQDAVPKNNMLVEELVKGLHKPGVAVAYACQLPEKGCKVLEAYARSFNYPETDRVKTKVDLPELGIKTYFASNACAAYQRDIYRELGGFIRKTIFNEDMIFAAGAINAGYGIAYCSKAKVIHSHNYTWRQQFHRNFDLAVSQADHPEVFSGVSSESEGIRLVKKNMAYLWKIKKPWLIPSLVLTSGFKYLGYRMGKAYKRLPKNVVMACTMNRNYWK